MRNRAWLITEGGAQLAVGPGGLILGRGVECDLVLGDPGASRRQALVRDLGDLLEVINLGRQPLSINGREVSGRATLEDGDTLALPGALLRVSVDHERRAYRQWLVSCGGAAFGVGPGGLSVGGRADDVCLEGLPAGAARFDTAAGELLVEVAIPATLDGEPLEPGELVAVDGGQVLALGGRALTVHGQRRGSTATSEPGPQPPRAARLRFEPVGGVLELQLHGRRAEVSLSELRANLVAALLAPPEGYLPGEFVPDELLLPMLWPREPGRDRTDINQLVHRVRRSLLAAGVHPGAVIERARAGNGTRMVLAPGAAVDVG